MSPMPTGAAAGHWEAQVFGARFCWTGAGEGSGVRLLPPLDLGDEVAGVADDPPCKAGTGKYTY